LGTKTPLGRRITLSHITFTKGEKTYEVIGVVGDAKYNDLEQHPPPTDLCEPLQEGLIGSQLAITHENRSRWSCQRGSPSRADVLKAVPIVRMMGERADRFDHRSTAVDATLSAGFGVLGALLAAIGLYGPTRVTRSRGAHMR